MPFSMFSCMLVMLSVGSVPSLRCIVGLFQELAIGVLNEVVPGGSHFLVLKFVCSFAALAVFNAVFEGFGPSCLGVSVLPSIETLLLLCGVLFHVLNFACPALEVGFVFNFVSFSSVACLHFVFMLTCNQLFGAGMVFLGILSLLSMV